MISPLFDRPTEFEAVLRGSTACFCCRTQPYTDRMVEWYERGVLQPIHDISKLNLQYSAHRSCAHLISSTSGCKPRLEMILSADLSRDVQEFLADGRVVFEGVGWCLLPEQPKSPRSQPAYLKVSRGKSRAVKPSGTGNGKVVIRRCCF